MSTKKQKEEIHYDQGCVLYVDGGCRPGYPSQPNSKCGGWGIHGYSYNLGVTPPKLRTKKDVPTQIGYEIGETVPLEQQVVPTEYVDAFGSMSTNDASDRAELTGFKNALDIIKSKGYKKAHLLLDNQYVIEGVTGGFERWMETGWKKRDGSNYANKEMWVDLMDSYYPLQQHVDFTVKWVNGHSGNLGNDRADYLATKGVYYARNGVYDNTRIDYHPIAKYRDPKPDINRLFTKSRWYFNTTHVEPDMSPDGRYVYHCGAHGSDDTLIGKPMADSVAYVVYTKTQMKVLEDIRQHHMRLIDNPLNLLCMMRLDTVLLPRIYHELETEGPAVLSIAPKRYRFKGLVSIDGQEVSKIIEPSGLTFKLIDVHNFMEKELQRYLEGKARLTDITSIFYEEVEIKVKKEIVKELKLIVAPTDKVLRPEVYIDENEKHRCALTVGIDVPPRELFNAIKSRSPKIYVTTWKLSPHAFRYAVIIDCGDDTVIWMGKDSSMQFVYSEELKQKARKL